MVENCIRGWIHLLVFLSAFLLFFVQPLAAKAVLPAFGGTAEVWSTTLFFFQLALLIGYLYVHGLGHLPPRVQVGLHLLLIAVVALLWRPTELLNLQASRAGSAGALLGLLAVGTGPFFIFLSAGSPLLQKWYALGAGKDPYPFYSTSNLGSILGLAAYPLLVEPWLGLPAQVRLLQAGFLLYAVLLLPLAVGWVWPRSVAAPSGPPAQAVGWRQVVCWVVYPLLGTVLLAAVTRHLTSEIAPMPLLWTLPLAAYLLSLVFCFAPRPFYPRLWVAGGALVCLLALMVPWLAGTHSGTLLGIPFALGAVGLGTWMVHGEMVRLRPDSGSLTGFYLCLAFGGVLGGGLVALVAPALWEDFWEFNFVVAVLSCLAAWLLLKSPQSWFHESRGRIPRMLICTVQALIVCFALLPLVYEKDTILFRDRNYYGKIFVLDEETRLSLIDGRTNHGIQAKDPAFVGVPGYFGPTSGASLAWKAMEKRRGGAPIRAAVLGLGAGCLADYMRPGDHMLFLEINPAVVRAAEEYFAYLRRARGTWETRIIDGRAGMAREPEASFDVIFMDAFSSGSIPVHLITREALELYQKRLRPGGVIVINISNRDLYFPPLIRALAEETGMDGVVVGSQGDGRWFYGNIFAVLSARGGVPDLPRGNGWSVSPLEKFPKVQVWTDHHSNVIQLMPFFQKWMLAQPNPASGTGQAGPGRE